MSIPVEKILKQATVVFLKHENNILLAKKSRYIGEGCWNGYGGGIEAGETAQECAIRELKEESGGVLAQPEDLEKIAEITYDNMKSDGNHSVSTVHFFVLQAWQGEPRETAEMLTPTWFAIDQLPLDRMMPADKQWVPLALAGKKIVATFKYGPFQKKLVGDVVIEEVSLFAENSL